MITKIDREGARKIAETLEEFFPWLKTGQLPEERRIEIVTQLRDLHFTSQVIGELKKSTDPRAVAIHLDE